MDSILPGELPSSPTEQGVQDPVQKMTALLGDPKHVERVLGLLVGRQAMAVPHSRMHTPHLMLKLGELKSDPTPSIRTKADLALRTHIGILASGIIQVDGEDRADEVVSRSILRDLREHVNGRLSGASVPDQIRSAYYVADALTHHGRESKTRLAEKCFPLDLHSDKKEDQGLYLGYIQRYCADRSSRSDAFAARFAEIARQAHDVPTIRRAVRAIGRLNPDYAYHAQTTLPVYLEALSEHLAENGRRNFRETRAAATGESSVSFVSSSRPADAGDTQPAPQRSAGDTVQADRPAPQDAQETTAWLHAGSDVVTPRRLGEKSAAVPITPSQPISRWSSSFFKSSRLG